MMGNKRNLGFVIFFWALVVAVVATAIEHRRNERTKGVNGLDKIIIRDRRGRSAEVLTLTVWFRSIDCVIYIKKLGFKTSFGYCMMQILFLCLFRFTCMEVKSVLGKMRMERSYLL